MFFSWSARYLGKYVDCLNGIDNFSSYWGIHARLDLLEDKRSALCLSTSVYNWLLASLVFIIIIVLVRIAINQIYFHTVFSFINITFLISLQVPPLIQKTYSDPDHCRVAAPIDDNVSLTLVPSKMSLLKPN